MTRIGSLFSGYGGLDGGVQTVLGGTVAWYCDFDKGPSKVLAHHWPDVPNLHDVTTIDWANVEPVDIITGGSPCQDVSAAGKRAGMRTGTRSGLWASMCDGIDIIRPSLVVWENVGGALSAGADSNVEPCPVCLGDTADVHLRALGRVLGDLAEIGYDAWWTTVRASDAGAPHSRLRVFVFGWPVQDTHVTARDQRWLAAPGQAQGGRAWSDAGRRSGAPTPDAAGSYGWPRLHDSATQRQQGHDEPCRGHAAAGRGGLVEVDELDHLDGTLFSDRVDVGRPVAGDELHPDERESVAHGGVHLLCGGVGLSSGDDGVSGHLSKDAEPAAGVKSRPKTGLDWGAYAPAITRWESVTGRGAPAPTEPGKTGQPRLSPAFVEWLMGLPDGHVTAVPGLTRNEQLKLLGNGVVPQQAALATRMFLTAMQEGAAA